MTEEAVDPSLALAATVLAALRRADIDVALIGAAALAVHNYPRATTDIDLATDVNPFQRLEPIRVELESAGLQAVLRLPDADDPLGGVLQVFGQVGGLVEVVNFYNPRSARPTNLGREAIRHAVPADIEGLDVLVVDLPHLVALKLYAGGPKSMNDVIGLLEANPLADLSTVERVCESLGLGPPLRRLLEALGVAE